MEKPPETAFDDQFLQVVFTEFTLGKKLQVCFTQTSMHTDNLQSHYKVNLNCLGTQKANPLFCIMPLKSLGWINLTLESAKFGVAALLQSCDCLVNPNIIYLPENPGWLCYSLLNKMCIYHHLSSYGYLPPLVVFCHAPCALGVHRGLYLPLHELMTFILRGRSPG